MTQQDRIGFGFRPADARSGLEKVARAEAAGFSTAWTVMPALARDTMTIFAAAAVQTTTIKLGTAIVPAFTRHPLALATQAFAIEDLAPGRLRLGIGTSHQRTMIAAYGFEFAKPLTQLREYLNVLKPALREGKVEYDGEFYTAHAAFPAPVGTPIMVSALRKNAFALAGELSDGAISWITPAEYLTTTARANLERGAAKAGRTAPPIIAHTFVSAQTDAKKVRKSLRQALAYYAEAPFYQQMFAAAGFPLGPGNSLPDDLLDALVIYGDPGAIADGLRARLESGLDELLIDVVPGDDQIAEENAVFAVVGRL